MIDGMIKFKRKGENKPNDDPPLDYIVQNRQRHGANRRLFAYASCFADFLKPVLRGTSTRR
jgi:hypothetical protein